jgi:hypothetical protein
VSRIRFAPWTAVVVAVVAAGLTLTAVRVQPAGAQLGRAPQVDLPVIPDSSSAAGAQPIQVQALDATHFVVVTREPRLVTKVNQDGPWQNMLLTVVTHYTVQANKLVPVEHIRTPYGYRAYGQ